MSELCEWIVAILINLVIASAFLVIWIKAWES